MTEPASYELYRVITDYEALQEAFLDRIEDLDTTLEQIDMAGEFTKGNVQKLLTMTPGKPTRDRAAPLRRKFGWESLGKMLKGTGMALVLVVDDERFAATREQLMKRKKPRQPANVGSKRPSWLFTKKKAREMGKRRFSLMSEAELKRHQRKAGKASAAARRRKSALARRSLPQVGQHSLPRGLHVDLPCPVAHELPGHTG
jgi:hypothetical protein